MAQVKNGMKWLNSEDATQTAWAFEYLRKRLPSLLVDQTSYSKTQHAWIRNALILYGENPTSELLIRKMRAAWTQKKHRARRKSKGQKTHNLILSNPCSDQLKKLAKLAGAPMNQTLEKLISEAHGITMVAEQRLKKEREKTQKEFNRLLATNSQLKKTTTALLSALEQAALQISLTEIQGKDATLEKVTDSQKTRALYRQQEWLDTLLTNIKPLLKLQHLNPSPTQK